MLALLPLLLTSFTYSRQVINLNEGWSFVRVPNPPSIWNGPDAVPTNTWRVLSVSSEEKEGEDGRASNAFDGNPNTIWHTEWSKRQPGYPHEIVMDLGSTVETTGLRILPRQTSPQNGRPRHFQLFLAKEPNHWGQPVLDESIPNTSDLYTKSFPVRSAYYLRLIFLDGQKPEPYLSLSEIGLIRNQNTSDHKTWESQYNIEHVATSGDRFDLNPKQLELTKKSELKLVTNKTWEPVTLPHAGWIRPMGKADIWQGVAYYRRTLDFPYLWLGKLVSLTLEGAMQSSDLWINGHHVKSRRGGYLPLFADLTPFLKDKNEILVRVDNRDNPIIPPGKPQRELDFVYGNGFYRNAYLTVTNPIHITDALGENVLHGGGIIVTTPIVTDQRAEIRVRCHLKNETRDSIHAEVRQSIVDENDMPVCESKSQFNLPANRAIETVTNATVAHPFLWSPDSPHMYRLSTTVWSRGHLIDWLKTPFGIRKIVVSRVHGFELNGKSIHLIGTNRHQDYPWIGPALSDAAQERDVVMLKAAGHNIVRLSHYPQSPAFLNACDRLGMMVIPCIPGWQFLNSDPRFNQRVDQDIRELIRRDRNHPCVAFWETSLNETYPPAAMANHWNAVAKSEAVADEILTAGDATKGTTWDIAYNQWKDDFTRPQDALPNRPGYIREYGDYEFGGDTSSSRVRIREGIPALLQQAWNHVWSLNRYRPQYPWTMGEGTWEMFDTNVPWRYQISACGLVDIFRRPKPTFWFFASQESKVPILKIASDWQPGDASRRLVVFTNCDQVELQVNGRSIATQKPVPGASTSYDACKPFDGSNTENLKHPPIVFDAVSFEAGTLKVRGWLSGKEVPSDIVKTAGKPDHLKLWLDDCGVAVTPNDRLFLRAATVDKAGTICPSGGETIRFEGSTTNLFAGENFAVAEMGVASALIQTGKVLQPLRIEASTKSGLHGGVTLFGKPLQKPKQN